MYLEFSTKPPTACTFSSPLVRWFRQQAREVVDMSTGEGMISPSEVKISSGRLGGYPIIANFLRKLMVRETIDTAVPMHPQNHVSHGECVEALILSILRENHALVNVSGILTCYDLSKIFEPTFQGKRRCTARIFLTSSALIPGLVLFKFGDLLFL